MGKKKKTLPSFEDGIARWMKRGDQAPMEPVDLAMWAGDVKFENDISDRTLFNERFIESRLGSGKLIDDAYMLSMLHTFFLVVMVAYVCTDPSLWYLVIPYLLFNSLFFLALWAIARPGGRIRFNRQAQLVQTMDGRGNVVAVPWRTVLPFFRLKMPGRVNLQLAFPPPTGVTHEGIVLNGVLWLDGGFDVLDDSDIPSAALRFEFIRRYMEEGLDAIQPSANLPFYSKPSGPPRIPTFYWVGFGPLIDRWAAHQAAKFRWPDEVERLCGENPDLSGHDTTPVASNKHIFYRYDPRGASFYLCDRNGVRLPPPRKSNLRPAAIA
ncbi:hypothetical protein ACFWP0_06595 [Achromobacter sp. NPDC058515]|uniref:hypothetical protein n=1 Tax=Achromobacter sp. NPDC058515 TaxID=3346533 RepID=UPI0036579E05